MLRRIWNYFAPSWEGSDGKFSYRRASAFIFVYLMVLMVARDRIQTPWAFYTFLTLAVLFSLIVAVLTVEQLIVLVKYASKALRDRGMDFGGADDVTYIDNSTKHKHDKQDNTMGSGDQLPSSSSIPPDGL